MLSRSLNQFLNKPISFMKILIKVTKDVLRRSMMCENEYGSNCAIAVAVRELFPSACVGASGMCIGDDYIINRLRVERQIYDVTHSQAVSDFIWGFDHLWNSPEERLNLPELSFEIEVPDSVIQSIGISEVYRILSESKTLEMVMPKVS
jgi:hypothetical protein